MYSKCSTEYCGKLKEWMNLMVPNLGKHTMEENWPTSLSKAIMKKKPFWMWGGLGKHGQGGIFFKKVSLICY
jgi:hypothetical protein